MSAETRLRPADSGDREYVETLLAENGLPVADVPERLEDLYVREVDGERVGVAGLEVHGEHGLVRSVAVERAARGEGHGRALCERLLAEAADAGVETAYLLTTTAAGFFADLGFVEADRESAPPSIRATTEFAELCPDSAVCMRREVER